jgi:ATP-binding cassette subfamily B protein
MSRRRFLAPEEIQTSAVDCGPAGLKILLAGFGIEASYGRLREACQTDVDGTSIDAIEDAAIALGLDAEQGLLPLDHVLLREAQALPALVVTRTPSRLTHFVIVWRAHGPWVQLSDPAVGRRWVRAARFLEEEVLRHAVRLPAEAFRAWAGSRGFTRPLAARLQSLGLGRRADVLIQEALGDGTWRSIAALDAATRFAAMALLRRGGPSQTEALVRALAQRPELVPSSAWTARPAEEAGDDGEVTVRGAVVITARISRAPLSRDAPVSPELLAARTPAVGPWKMLWSIVRSRGGPSAAGNSKDADAPVPLAGAAAAVVLVAAAEPIEALVLRASVAGAPQVWLYVVSGAIAVVVWLLATRTLRLGAHLECELWRRFLTKVPRLEDRYLKSRPLSDMARTAHAIPTLRALPRLVARAAIGALSVVALMLTLVWVAPEAALPALLLGLGSMATPLACLIALAEREQRRDAHAGGLGRYHLEALLGLVPLRAHRGARALVGEHERLLSDWTSANRAFDRLSAMAASVEAAVSIALLVLVFRAAHPADAATALLVGYLALRTPMQGRTLGAAVRDLTSMRSTLLRILEPLGAPEPDTADDDGNGTLESRGAEIVCAGVETKAGGHVLLADLDLSVPAGAHVAIVGPSGAGKTTLLGLLLGWCRLSRGSLCVDGAPLVGGRLRALRQATAWVEPTVRLWNRTLDENLRYGSAATDASSAIEGAGLKDLIARLPEGTATVLGEGGRLVAGGAAQRVRFARALLRPRVRLAVLDEPFRGLPRSERHRLLQRARTHWKEATLLFATHDIEETRAFDRVLVVEDGRVVEDGNPTSLARPGTRYHALLEAQRAVARELWESRNWRRLVLCEGKASEVTVAERAVWSAEAAPPTQPNRRAGRGGRSPCARPEAPRPDDLAWPVARLGEAMTRISGGARVGEPSQAARDDASLAERVERSAAEHGLHAEPLSRIPTAKELARGHALLFLPGRASFVLVTPAFTALRPDGAPLPAARARGAVLGALAGVAGEVDGLDSLEKLFADLGLRLRRDAVAGGDGIALPAPGFLLWPCRDAPAVASDAPAAPRVVFALVRALQIGFECAAWYVLGSAALQSGSLVSGVMGWLALQVGSATCRLAARAVSARFARAQAAALKRTHLRRALGADIDSLEHEGVGQLFGRVSLSDASVSLRAAGVPRLLISAVAIGAASGVLALGAGARGVAWLAVGVLAVVAIARRSASAASEALDQRLTLSHDLTEQLAGHRTRLAQLHPRLWHVSEDQQLDRYHSASARGDSRRAILEVLSWAWGVVAFGLLATAGSLATSTVAMAAGGVLLARHALRVLASSLQILVDADVAQRRAAQGIADAQVQGEPQRHRLPVTEGPLLESRGLSAAFRGAPSLVEGCSFAIAGGERCLLEGASGSGKSLLLQVIGGLRRPGNGVLTVRGDARHAPVLVPPFHQNHLFTHTLAFNLLLGRRWPPTDDDLEDASLVCRELELGPLVERMPGGLHQIVGDSGWQLSDGERSRVFVARALLQDPDLVMLDGSFGALDPDTKRRAMQCVLERARALLAVVQP